MFRTRSSTAGPGLPPLWGIVGKAGYVLCCIVSATVLLASGWAHYAYQNLAALGQSHALVSGPSIGEQNILLMGLESRTYWNGQVLPNDILGALHAGSRQGVLYENVGGNTTNTLILIHIPAGGGKAVGISIPRDDYVTFPQPYDNQSAGKIDQAYGLALAAKESELETANHTGLTDQIAFQGNEAGRSAAIATVEQVTGIQHIDHFAEVNLWGFYEMAKALGGVNVCLNHPIWPPDQNSGFYAKRAGYQHLNPKLALAFVRQRDGLTNGDLDRTHRQQAFIDSVLHQIRGQGVLTDLGKINSMLSTASQYVITDSGWDLADFATQMQSLTPGHISFRTAPIAAYGKVGTEDVNEISVPQIQQFVHENFFPAPAAGKKPASKTAAPKADPAATTVDVYNGGNTPHLASDVANALVQAGYKASSLGNAPAKEATTQVLYGSGVAGGADALASAFGVTAQPSSALPAGTVKVVLGVAATTVPSFGSGSGTAAGSSTSASSTPTPSTQPTNNANGGAVHAVNGIPCVD